jgi:uncharacterized delta-60 repeat protein
MRGGASIRRFCLAAALGLLAVPATAAGSVGNFAIAVQPDGRILAAGGAGYAGGLNGGREYGAVARYLPDGRLDRSFGGGDGVVLVREQRPFTAIALQGNGRIILTSPIGGQGGLTRLLPSGRLDLTFGEGGILYGGAASASYPTSVAVRGSGRIFVGGMTGYLSEPAEHWYGWLYRITSNGRTGDRFAGMTDGAGEQPKTFINDFVFGPGGSVIGAGTIGERRLDAKTHAVLARLLPGTVSPGGVPTGADPSFGGGAGLVQSDVYPASPFSETANALSWNQGKLLVAGEANSDLMVSRYTREGILDRGFGRRGFTTAGFGRTTEDVANALDVDSRGGIYVAGGSSHGCGSEGCASLLLARYGKDGRFVRGFGRGGIVSPSVDSKLYGRPASEIAYDLAVLSQGRILVGGLVTGPGSSRFFLRRYLADGTPDRTFGDRGRVTTVPALAERAR